MPKPRVLVLYTGGTIGMTRTPDGYRPEPGHLQALISGIPQFRAPEVPEFVVREFDPLLDSSNMTPADWIEIARAVVEGAASFDGFLVLHGTDTMAYTASALSFVLRGRGVRKPVVLTGSQIPLEQTRNDAQENLLTSLLFLGRYHDRLPGVYLSFGDRVFRGNRATKVDADGFGAFDSPNLAPVATVGIDYDVEWELAGVPGPEAAEPPAADPLSAGDPDAVRVASFRLFPGMRAENLENILRTSQGVVLECYGAGNAPDRNREFMAALAEATGGPGGEGVVVVDVTQPLHGSADLDLYATGSALKRVGVVSGYDMTAEAALTKLWYLFHVGLSPREVRALVGVDLCGELTPPERVPAAVRAARVRVAGPPPD